MNDETCALWGFDGDFAGNEDRVFARLPIVRLPATSQLAAADTLYWSPVHGDGLTLFPDEAAATEAGTRIPVDGLQIGPGRYVVLAGPEFLAQLALLPALLHASPDATLKDGWMIFLLDDAQYDDLCTSLLAYALEAFDEEVRTTKDTLSRRAETALTLLRANPLTPLEVQQTRTLAARLLRHDAEGYSTTLELSAMRLRVPLATLRQRLHDYLSMLGRDELIIPGLESSPPGAEIAEDLQRRLHEGPDPLTERAAARTYVAELVQYYEAAYPAGHLREAVDQLFNRWTPDEAAAEAESARLFTLFAVLPTNEGFVAVVSYLAGTARLEHERAKGAPKGQHRLLTYTLNLLIENEKALLSLNAQERRVPAILWERFMEAAWSLLPLGDLGVRAYELLLQHVKDLSELLLEVLSNEKVSIDLVKELLFRRTDEQHWLDVLQRCIRASQMRSDDRVAQQRLYELALPYAESFEWEATEAFYCLSETVVPKNDRSMRRHLNKKFRFAGFKVK